MSKNLVARKYVSTDIEASGRTPGKYSMLSIGSCIVGDFERKNVFYRELKPISPSFQIEAMRVGCLGLRYREDHAGEEFNPKSDRFDPRKVLEILMDTGEDPKKTMSDYADWVRDNTRGFKPVEAAAPIRFDGMFTAWYFDNFYEGENPFGHSAEDICSFYRGLMRSTTANIKNLRIRHGELSHNALADALQQAEEFEEILRQAGLL